MKITSFLLLGLAVWVVIAPARDAGAHFKLVAPPSWTTENQLGDPQKATPCGGEGGSPTNIVTNFRPGQTITVEWSETIYHPGHFRIALAADRNQFEDPVVTVDSNQISVSATIQDPPVAPVLLDNLYPRTSPNGSAGTTFRQDVVLPNMTCERCTLQLIQFMTGHGPPNYIYFHCADLRIVDDTPADAGTALDATDEDSGSIEADAAEGDATEADATRADAAAPDTSSDAGGSMTIRPTTSGSCGCRTSNDHDEALPIASLLFIAVLASRRCASHSR